MNGMMFKYILQVKSNFNFNHEDMGGVAQMVERSLSMREARGSIPRISKKLFLRPFSIP